MADFVQMLKDWRRMCKNRPCDFCRLAVNDICNTDPESRTDEDIWKIEKTISEWAAEHPEPVYPTWGEWFVSKGMLPDKWDNLSSEYIYVGCVPNLMHTPIPADIAEKLGIEPKEG